MTDLRARLEQRLREDRDRIIGAVQAMVQIPSENPPGDTTAIFDHVTRLMERQGLDFEVVAPQPTMPNLVASFDGGQPGRHLVLNGHLDVFPAGDPALWQVDPFSGAIRDGKLYGRGVTDMKVGTTASILTYAYLAELRQHLKGRLTLTAVSDEETFGPWGARYLIEHRPDVLGDCVLNGEPSTPVAVRFGEKGILWLEIAVATAGGHGAYAQVSRNAIKALAAIVRELEAVEATPVTIPDDVAARIEAARAAYDSALGPNATDVLRRVTVNIGTIHGGLKVNMIAADCRAEVDIRCPIGVPTAVPLEAVEAIVARHQGATLRVLNRSEPNAVAPDHELIGIVQRNAEQITGIRPQPAISLGGTDCRLWRLKGIPAVVYGPTPNGMGQPDEYVTLDELLSVVHVHVLSAFDYLTA